MVWRETNYSMQICVPWCADLTSLYGCRQSRMPPQIPTLSSPKPVSMKVFFPFLFKEVPNLQNLEPIYMVTMNLHYHPPQLISQCVSSLSRVCHCILHPDLIFICARTDHHHVPDLHESRKLRDKEQSA